MGLIGLKQTWYDTCPFCDGTKEVTMAMADKIKKALEERRKKGWPVPPSGLQL